MKQSAASAVYQGPKITPKNQKIEDTCFSHLSERTSKLARLLLSSASSRTCSRCTAACRSLAASLQVPQESTPAKSFGKRCSLQHDVTSHLSPPRLYHCRWLLSQGKTSFASPIDHTFATARLFVSIVMDGLLVESSNVCIQDSMHVVSYQTCV